ncbi:MAG: hypothetical protein H9893_14150 [Candidatus Niameybacter stercoravium]|nr:hypothetical protein [Candidatus Niameybacter stercoravium]
MNNLIHAKNKFLHRHLYKHLVLLGIFNCLFIGLYLIDEGTFLSVSKGIIFSLAIYLMINAFSTRYITQSPFLSYISIFYGAINLLLSLRFVALKLFSMPINRYYVSMSTYHIDHISFGVFLIILTITYIKKPKRLEFISCILMGCLALIVIFLFPALSTKTFADFVTSHTLHALLFNLCSNLFLPIAMIFTFYMLYPIRYKIPDTHKIIMIIFGVCCMIYESINLIYFIPLTAPDIISYFFRFSSLYLLIIGQIDCCILRPFGELYLKNEASEKMVEDTYKELYRYSTYAAQLESNFKVKTTHYERILSIFPEPFLLCVDNKILDTNQAALDLFHCFNKHSLCGNILFDYLKLDAETIAAYNNLLEHPNELLKGETTLTTLDDEVYDVEYLITTTYLHESINIVCILRNITEKKQKLAAEKALAEQNLKMNYFSSLSHDIKMPINIIYSALQMQEHATTLPECLHYTGMMQSNSLKLLKLINNILDLTKLDNNMLQFSSQIFNIVDAVETLCEASYFYMKEKNISYTFDTDLDECLIHTDSAAFERIIFNLLSNAVKYTPPGGQLYITVSGLVESIQIDILDTGIGIPADELDHIFDRFVTSNQGTSSKEHSCGIGLSIVRDLVHIMGGTITCHSKLNEGSCFSIVLPTPPIDNVIIDQPYQSTYTSHNIKIEFCDI